MSATGIRRCRWRRLRGAIPVQTMTCSTLAVQSSSARALPAAFPDGCRSSGLLPRLVACWNGERIRGVGPVVLRQQSEHGGRRRMATRAG